MYHIGFSSPYSDAPLQPDGPVLTLPGPSQHRSLCCLHHAKPSSPCSPPTREALSVSSQHSHGDSCRRNLRARGEASRTRRQEGSLLAGAQGLWAVTCTPVLALGRPGWPSHPPLSVTGSGSPTDWARDLPVISQRGTQPPQPGTGVQARTGHLGGTHPPQALWTAVGPIWHCLLCTWHSGGARGTCVHGAQRQNGTCVHMGVMPWPAVLSQWAASWRYTPSRRPRARSSVARL